MLQIRVSLTNILSRISLQYDETGEYSEFDVIEPKALSLHETKRELRGRCKTYSNTFTPWDGVTLLLVTPGGPHHGKKLKSDSEAKPARYRQR